MSDIDQISQQAAQEKSTAEKIATTAAKPLRAALGAAANVVAKNQMLGSFQSRTDLSAPELIDPTVFHADGTRSKDTRQFQTQKMDFTPQGGSTQKVEGWVMPAQPGNPTVVFFGGSDFDRSKQSYQDGISLMANEAKQRGLGFAVFDYPEGVNEEMAKEFVGQVQGHLADQGVSLDQQAYAGYSQGSFMATQAAATNQNAAGLHIVSGFSSGRMAQKEGIDQSLDSIHLKPLASLIEKRQLTEVWDNMPAANDIGQRRAGQAPDARMPISAAYDSTEDFGKAGNRHMGPLIAALTSDDEGFQAKVSNGTDHLSMLTSGANLDGFKQFATDTKNYVANPARQIVQQQPRVDTPAIADTTAPQKTSVRDMLRGAADRISSAASDLKATITDKVDQLKLERLEKQLDKRQNHLDGLKKDLQAMGDLDTRQDRDTRLAELQSQYDPTSLDTNKQIDIANEIDEIKAANKLEDRIEKNKAKVDKLETKVKAQEDKIKLRADRKKNDQAQDQPGPAMGLN